MFDYLNVGDEVIYVLNGRSTKIKVTGRTAHQIICYD